MSELVFIQNERVLTTSLKVAEKFEKEHRNVVRDIRVLINQMEGMLKNEHTPFFEESTYTNEQNKQTYPMHLMDFNGFTLIRHWNDYQLLLKIFFAQIIVRRRRYDFF